MWPRQIFTCEAQEVLDFPPKQGPDDAVRLLLEEAFHNDAAREYLDDNRDRFPEAEEDGYDFFSAGSKAPLAERSSGLLLKDLLTQLDSVGDYKPRRFFSARRSAETGGAMGLAETKRDFTRLIGDWYKSGYFDRAFGGDCPDEGHDAIASGQKKLAEVTGLDEILWPPLSGEALSTAHEGWSEDVFLTLVEALFDEIARPRTFWWHDFCRHRHYLDFSKPTGQELYLWRVNELLDRSVLPFRLSSDSPDRGYVVSLTFGPLHELAHQSLVSAPNDDRGGVGHALKLFRSRTATRHEKRSAVVELAGLLEARREAIKSLLATKDEGDLFNIANNFALRHRDMNQKGDYREAWLDWIFWWYLSTLKLTYSLEADSTDSSEQA